jgi:DNA-binding MarR family transcriptional regulator
MHDARLVNLLGATALALTDLMVAATRMPGVSTRGAAALVSLRFAPGLSVTELGRHVGLTQSAAARMTDSLVAAGLVTREPGAGREVAVTLTAEGAAAADRVLAARAEPLAELIEPLTDDERKDLTALLTTILPRVYDRVGSTDLICRLCDRDTCTTNAHCPVGAAAR